VWPETRLDQVNRRLKERRSNLVFLDLRQDLLDAREKHSTVLYNRYENHWNDLGSFFGYASIMREVKKSFPAVVPLHLSDFEIGVVKKRWDPLPVVEQVPTLTLKEPSKVFGKEAVLSVGPQTFYKTTTRITNGPEVLVFGDSFSEEGLLAKLSQTFKSTIFISTNWAPFPTAILEKYHPDLVILQMIERYMGTRLGNLEAIRRQSDVKP
jgi:alginate O-acetyltransferase complex protein AlgJ